MTTYYSLKVLRTQDVAWNPRIGHLFTPIPSLYTEIEVNNIVQRTNTVKEDISPSWDETLPLVCPRASMSISIKIKHRSRLKGRDKTVGYAKVEITKLLDDCKEGETRLQLGTSATVILRLEASDAKASAELALQNLVRNLDQGSLAASKPEEVFGKTETLVKEGKNAIKKNSNLAKAFVNAVPVIDGFVATMDKVTDANPYLKLAWYMVSALYKIVSDQVKADKLFKDLVEILIKIFDFVKDTEHLRNILHSFQNTISKLLSIVIECCLLLRKHAHNSFVVRSLSAVDKKKIRELRESLISLKTELNEGFTRQTAVQVAFMEWMQDLGTIPNCDENASERSVCFEDTQIGIRGDIKEWILSASNQNILWLNGVAGSGKSTIATTIAKEFRSSSLGAYLLFRRGISNPASIFRTIACRLAATNLVLASLVIRNKNAASNTAKEDFDNLFKSTLLSADDVEGPILIILDGLDECGSSWGRQELMLWLEHDFSELPPKFRFLITSRPEDDIVRSLKSKPHVRELKLDHTSESSRRDVQAYLSYALRNSIKSKRPGDWDWENVLKTLSEAANGLFIWASILVKFISKHAYPFKCLEDLVLNTKTLSLRELYSAALREAFSWDETTKTTYAKVIALILFQKGHMQISDNTIDGILGLAPHTGSANILLKLQSLIAFESGQPIHLHHVSFYDYLTSPSNVCDSDHPWFFDIKSQKQIIAGRCFDIMASMLRFNICDLETSFVLNEDVFDLGERIETNIPSQLVYACRCWAQHLRDVPFSEDLLEKLTTFTYANLLSWFEVLSLTKNFYHQVGQALQDAIEWVGVGNPELSSFLRQASNLASTFAVPIAESTPHIYTSMLPLTEKDSDVSIHYLQKLPLLPLVAVERKGVKPVSSLLKLFEGHTSIVSSVRFSPDGKRVVSGSYDNTVCVWDVESGKILVGPLKGHTSEVTSVGFSPDGKCVVSGSADNTLRVWNIERGGVSVDPFEGHTSIVASVEFSPDGKKVVSGSHDKTVRVWDIDSGKTVAGPFEGHTSCVYSARFSPDGKCVVSGSHDNTVRVWSVESSKTIAGPFKGHTSFVYSVGFSPDGKYVVSGSADRTVLVWDLENGKVIGGPFKEHTSKVISVEFSPDGKYVVSGSHDGTVRIWDIDTGKTIAGPFEGHTAIIMSASFSPDGKFVVSGAGDKTIRIWDIDSGKDSPGHLEELKGRVCSVDFSPDGKCIVSGSRNNMVWIWDIETGETVAGPFEGHTSYICAVRFSPDGKRVASGSNDNTVWVWNIESGKAVGDPFKKHKGIVVSVDFSPDGKRIVSSSLDGTVLVWDVESGFVVAGPFIEHIDRVFLVEFSLDGKYIILRYLEDTTEEKQLRNNTISAWDVENGSPVSDLDPTYHYKSTRRITSIQAAYDTYPAARRYTYNAVFGFFVSLPIKYIESAYKFGTLSQDGRHIAVISTDGSIIVSKVLKADRHTVPVEEFSTWSMSGGWIYGKKRNLVLWIPPDIRPTLLLPHHIGIFNCRFSTRVDFTSYSLEGKWYK